MGKRLEAVKESIKNFGSRRKADEGKLLVMPVMIPSGPYLESAERRLRTRQAVLTALGAEQFVPKDGEHIGYFELPVVEGKKEANLLVPFERLRFFGARSPKTYSQVLVLWVCDDTPDASPVKVLAALGRELPFSRDDVALRIVGPSSSTGVYSMLEELERGEYEPNALVTWLLGAEMISPMSTVGEEPFSHVPDFSNPSTAQNTLAVRISKLLQIPFRRTIITDDLVAREMAEELKRRGIELSSQDPSKSVSSRQGSIALVSEWDTLYGRVLPLTFAQQLWAGLSPEKRAPTYRQLIEGSSEVPTSIEAYYYLRGIDGRSPDEGRESSTEATSPNRDRPPVRSEGTEGENQADYLRRLVGLLKQRHKELLNDGRGGFKAIGVLGSDVYDKLMVLRALRKEFPGVLFFSNNLDARLAMPEEWKAARNLIVASPFGLQLHPKLQSHSAPFRDSYQTSMYAGARLALGNRAFDRDFQQEIPRIFEIGRHGAVDLSGKSTNGPLLFPERLDQESLIYRKSSEWTVKRLSLTLLLWLLLVTVIGMIVFKAGWIDLFREGGQPFQIKNGVWIALGSTRVMLALACCIAAVVLFGFWCFRNEGSEPFSLFSGVSAWPTFFLQIAIGVLAVHFIYRASDQLRRSEEDVSREIGNLKDGGGLMESPPEIPPEESGPVSSQVPYWMTPVIRFFKRLGWKSQGVNRSDFVRPDAAEEMAKEPKTDELILIPEVIWREYLKRVHVRSNLIYTASAAMIVVILGLISAQIWPAAGHPMRDLKVLPWLVFPTVLGLGTVLTLYTFQVIRQHSDLVSIFNLGRTAWPISLVDDNPRHRFLSYRAMCEYLDIRLIAASSEAAVKIVQYPFLIMVLMVVSTASCFDNWSRPGWLLMIYAFNLVMAVVAAVTLARAASRARERALRNLRRQRFLKMAEDDPSRPRDGGISNFTIAPMDLPPTDGEPTSPSGKVALLEERKVKIEEENPDRQKGGAAPDPRWSATQLKVLDEVIAEVSELRRGALAPMWEQPVFRAVIYSSGSLGLGSLIQHMPWLF